MTRTVVIATRNSGKLREIRQIAQSYPELYLQNLAELCPEDPVEEELEEFATFRENALAKARHFAARAGGRIVLAEDSGLCVDALDGAPGVRSKRFGDHKDISGADLDEANNELLLTRLQGVPAEARTARFVCCVAIVYPDAHVHVFTGELAGEILVAPRGTRGFGYDGLFYVPPERASLGELPEARKNQISHRFAALRQALDFLDSRA